MRNNGPNEPYCPPENVASRSTISRHEATRFLYKNDLGGLLIISLDPHVT